MRRLMSIVCRLIGHDWWPYDFDVDKMNLGYATHIDKCKRCHKEKSYKHFIPTPLSFADWLRG